MKTSRLVGLVIILVVGISLAAIWFYPLIQDFMVSNTLWNGIRKFSKEFNVQNTDSIVNLPDSPKKDVLFTIPYIKYDAGELIRIKQFVENGGKLIMMDDFGYGNSFLEYAGITARFDNIPLLDPLFNYKNEYFPRIMDFNSNITDSGVKVVSFNHATALNNVGEPQALAWSSNMSFLDTNHNSNWDIGEPKGPFVAAAEYRLGEGTIDLVSDPSLIINAMVGSNDNYGFVKYLIYSNGTPDNILLDRQSVINRIEQCTYEEKRLALDALDIKVKVTPEKIEITGVIPVNVTSAQSSTNGQNPMHQLTDIPMSVNS